MKYRNVLLAGTMLLFIAQGCTAVPTFPNNGAAAPKTPNEFGALVADPDTYQGRAVRLAGRMVSVETTDEGTMIVAEWLPFPERGQYGPTQSSTQQPERFALFYPGMLDSMGTRQGNKFIVAGAMKGMKDMVTLEGRSKSLPYVEARCLHVWKTGTTEFSDHGPDVEQTGFPPLRQTYCTNA